MAEKPVAAVGVIKSIFLASIIAIPAWSQTEKPKVKDPVEIDLLYSYYMQDGNHSVVTGGTGTEELNYHAPTVLVHIPTDSISKITVKAGVDIYSSASQDNIDFNVSSASAQDARTHMQIGYQTQIPKKEIFYSYQGSFSIESDYLSFGLGGSLSKGFKNYNDVFSISAQTYFDDCRWGWLGESGERYLIYPEELRGTNWESKYRRYTNTLSLSYTKLLSKRANIGFFVDGVWQTGLLSTTFHRIYFQNSHRETIEKLPYERLKLPLAVRFNYFFNRHVLLRTYYRYYADNWQIQAHTFEIEPVIKVGRFLSVMPFYRYYQQSNALWFAPYKGHSITQEYYTSDYDLSSFTAHKFGLGVSWKPLGGFLDFNKRGYGWQGLQLRSGFYNRSDGLHAFFLSSVLNFGKI